MALSYWRSIRYCFNEMMDGEVVDRYWEAREMNSIIYIYTGDLRRDMLEHRTIHLCWQLPNVEKNLEIYPILLVKDEIF